MMVVWSSLWLRRALEVSNWAYSAGRATGLSDEMRRVVGEKQESGMA